MSACAGCRWLQQELGLAGRALRPETAACVGCRWLQQELGLADRSLRPETAGCVGCLCPKREWGEARPASPPGKRARAVWCWLLQREPSFGEQEAER
jgi:hypothetical protein